MENSKLNNVGCGDVIKKNCVGLKNIKLFLSSASNFEEICLRSFVFVCFETTFFVEVLWGLYSKYVLIEQSHCALRSFTDFKQFQCYKRSA